MNHVEVSRTAAEANEIEARAAMWLRRRHWDWNDEQQAALDAWLGESWAHSVAFWRLEAAWDRTERLAALRAGSQAQPAVVGTQTAQPFLFKAAMGVACAALIGFGALWWSERPNEQVYATALGQHKKIALADGSSVELNTDTVLRIVASASGRTASLDQGEAYFQIRHDAARPFVVMAGNHRVTDLGTKFVVRNDADNLKVTLLEGRVRLDAAGQKPVLLAPGDELVAAGNSISKTRKSVAEMANALGWKRGVLVFQNTSLGEAAAEFNRYNSRKLVVADAMAARRTIGASFPSNNVELFAHMVRDVLRLRVEDRGDEIVISR